MHKYSVAYGKDGAFPALGGTAALADASAEELRVLLCVLSAGGEVDGDATASLAAAAGCSPARVGSALRYWHEVGVLCEGEPVHKPAALMTREPGQLDAAEIAEIVAREDLPAFLDALQQLAGRIFNTKELETVVSLIEEMPFSREYFLTLASYCQKKSGRRRFSVRYMAQVAYTMLEKEILTEAQLDAYLAAAEKTESMEWQLRRLLGIGERRLGSREEEYFTTWVGGWDLGMDVIGIAYDITVNRTGKISLPYMNKLLSTFYANGCKNAADVDAYLARERAEQDAKKAEKAAPKGKDKAAEPSSSYDPTDYMAAALRRSYGDDGA